MDTLEIVVKVTDACNARCVYCESNASGSGRGRMLSRETAASIVEQSVELIDSKKVRGVSLLWHGGEPLLLGKDFFRELLRLPGIQRLDHRLQSNLCALDEEWLEILEGLVGKDGLGSSYDPFSAVRVLPGGGYREAWRKAVGLLVQRGWSLGCVYVVHAESLGRERDLYWFFRNLRDNSTLSLRVNPLLALGRGAGSECDGLRIGGRSYGEFLVSLASEWRADFEHLSLAPVSDLVARWRGESVRLSCDLAGRDSCLTGFLGLDWRGDAYLCGRAVDARDEPLGNIGRESLSSIWESSQRSQRAEKLHRERGTECGSCEYWDLCHGGCFFESSRVGLDRAQRSAFCEGMQVFFEWVKEEIGPRRARAATTRGSAVCGSSHVEPRGVEGVGEGGGEAAQSRRAACAALDVRIGASGANGGVDRVLEAALAGDCVVLDRLSEWKSEQLEALVERYLFDPSLEGSIEPFQLVLLGLLGLGGGLSLRRFYRVGDRDEESEYPIPSECETCDAYKGCRGFWVRECGDDSRCSDWRRVVARIRVAARSMAQAGTWGEE